MQQIKALKEGDTAAFIAWHDRVYGKPKQAIQMEGLDIKPIITRRMK